MADLQIIRTEEVKTVAKHRLKLVESPKKGYTTMYDQCSNTVKEKLGGTEDWDKVQQEQLLHDLICKI